MATLPGTKGTERFSPCVGCGNPTARTNYLFIRSGLKNGRTKVCINCLGKALTKELHSGEELVAAVQSKWGKQRRSPAQQKQLANNRVILDLVAENQEIKATLAQLLELATAAQSGGTP